MKNLICERILGAVLALTLPAEFIGVMGMESDAGAWAWWLCVACAALQLTAIVMVHVAARRERQSPSRGDAATAPFTQGDSPDSGGNVGRADKGGPLRGERGHAAEAAITPSAAVRRSPSLYTREARAVEGLAAARSTRGSDTPQGCHSLPLVSLRYARPYEHDTSRCEEVGE